MVVSNLRPVISNRLIIMGLIVKVRNKDPYNMTVPYGNRFRLFGRFFIMKVCISLAELLTRSSIQS